MKEAEGRGLATVPKSADPNSQWTQESPNTLTNVFGVLDSDGKSIKGVHVELAVFISPKLGLHKFVFTLWRVELGKPERAYQLHINARDGLRPGDHAYSHEHYGQECRIEADPSWAKADFGQAVGLFCERCAIELAAPVPHYQELNLK